MPEIRVLIVAKNLLVRTGLAAMLAARQDVLVVGQVAVPDDEGDTLANALDTYRPEVVVFDLGYDPAATLPHVIPLVEAPISVIALLPDDDSVPLVLAALGEAGAYGLLHNDSGADLLANAIRAVRGGLVAVEPGLMEEIVRARHVVSPADTLYQADDLTPRENEVLQLMAQGLTNKAIAHALAISANTVKFHVNAILSKLGAQSRTEAVVRATQLGLIVL